MQKTEAPIRQKFLGWLLLLLLLAAALRLVALTTVPPGLTHDEAAHGITAISILEGSRALYFSIAHGREPFYDYATAALMAGIGPTFLAGRLTAVYLSLLLIAGMAAWVRRAFGWQTAVLTAAGLAVSFWPLMSARQSLRSIALPALFVLAVHFFWQATTATRRPQSRERGLRNTAHGTPLTAHGLAALFLGLTFYTYIPARILWLVLPLTLAYLAWVQRPSGLETGRSGLLALAAAGLMALPLFFYLYSNPEAEIRIQELSGPLTAATRGDFSQLWQNAAGGLGIIAWRGDDFWRYNIPGRPLLTPLMALLFGVGLFVAGRWAARPSGKGPEARWRGAASFLALCWLGIGLAPVLVTGPHLSTTQAIAIQPVLYLFPALALREIARRWLPTALQSAKIHLHSRSVFWLAAVALFGSTAVFTSRDYFITWAYAPEVRVQYEAAMTAVMHYLKEQDGGDVAIATITPGHLHTPALAMMMVTNGAARPRWFDGRSGLLIPNAENGTVILSGFAPLPQEIGEYGDMGAPVHTIPQPAHDLDRPLSVYRLNAADWLAAHQADFTDIGVAEFGQAATFVGYVLRPAVASPGSTLQLLSLWRLENPSAGVRLFTHVSGADGVPVAQADLLSAPGETWMAGDLLLQLHEISLPATTAPGPYALTTGLYTCLDAACKQSERLPLRLDGRAAGHVLYLQEITIQK